jgi:hypothetical protein
LLLLHPVAAITKELAATRNDCIIFFILDSVNSPTCYQLSGDCKFSGYCTMSVALNCCTVLADVTVPFVLVGVPVAVMTMG